MTGIREAMIIVPVLFVAAVCTVAGVSLSEQSLVFALSPMAILVGCAAVLFVFDVLTERKWPLALIFVMAILIFNSAIRTEALEARRAAFDAVSFMRLGVFLSAFAVGLVAIAKTYTQLLRPPGIHIFLYWCLAFLSFLYSSDPTYTLGAAFGLLAWIILAVTMAQRFTLRELLITTLGACAAFIYLSWVLYLFVPSLGQFVTGGESHIVRFIGLAGQPNAAGQIMAIYLVTLVCFYVGDPRGYRQLPPTVALIFVLGAVLALGALVLSQSRGSALGLMSALVLILFHKTHSVRLAFLGALIIVPLIVIVFVSTFDPIRQFGDLLVGISRGGTAEEILTLTGRTRIWAFSWDKIMDNPLLGHGYGAGQAVLVAGYANRWGDVTTSAHNALIQTLLDLGFLGGAALSTIFAHSFYRLFTRPHLFRDSIFILVFVFCILESGISKAANALSLIWILSLFADEMRHSIDTGARREPASPARLGVAARAPASTTHEIGIQSTDQAKAGATDVGPDTDLPVKAADRERTSDMRSQIIRALQNLSMDERIIVAWSSLKNPSVTQKEIAAALGVSEERIAQIKENALRKLMAFCRKEGQTRPKGAP